jgi:cellulose synthase/poly-beta-1,6-N-acetylglucosamine synthase-like glycosyltransferase
MIVFATVGLVLATLLQLWFWGVRFARLARYQLPELPIVPDAALPPVSIIICAHNEADNLQRNLPFFLEQDYPKFEVLVINDNSSDKTSEIILEFQKKYQTLRSLSMEEETPPGKKAALSYGIRQSSFELLFLSDTDCQPKSRQWLRIMQRSFQGNKKIVLGYGPYQKRRGWLNRFIRFEAFYTAIQYFSFALAGHPYMGVGRNLAYHRSVYWRANGFENHAHLISGDDDLLINQVASGENTTVNLFPDAKVFSHPQTSWRGYYYQKRRHLSVGSYYRWQDQIALGALALSHFTFYAATFLLLILLPEAWCLLSLNYLVRIGVVLLVSNGASKHLGEQNLLPYLPLLDFLYLAYYFTFAPSLLIGSRIQQWK